MTQRRICRRPKWMALKLAELYVYIFFNESKSSKIKVLPLVSKHFDGHDNSRKIFKFVRKLINCTHETVCCYWNSSECNSVCLLIPIGLWQSSLLRVRVDDNRSAVTVVLGLLSLAPSVPNMTGPAVFRFAIGNEISSCGFSCPW
jgi:hypothetical protein